MKKANGHIQVEKGVPLPKGYSGGKFKPTLEAMKDGESFVVADTYSHRTLLYQSAHRSGIKIAIRKIGDGNIRVWRAASATK